MRVLPCLLAPSLLCAAAFAQSASIAADEAPGLRLGIGWDNLRMVTSAQSPLTVPQPKHVSADDVMHRQASITLHVPNLHQEMHKTAQGQVVTSRMTMIESVEQLAEMTSAEASFSYASGFNSANGKASFFRSVAENNYDLHFLVQVMVTQDSQYIEQPQLSQVAIDLLKKDVASFHDTYGTDFVTGIETGGEYLGMITVHCSSRTEQQQVSAQLSGGMATWSASASFENSTSSLSMLNTIEVQEMRSGGPARAVPLATTGSDAVAQMLASARDFPNQVNSAPVAIRFTTAPLAGLAEYRLNASQQWREDPATAQFRATVSTMLDYEQRLADYELALQHPDAFYHFDPAPIVAAHQQLTNAHSQLATAISDFRARKTPDLNEAKNVPAIAVFDQSHHLPQRYQGYVDGMCMTWEAPTMTGEYHLTEHTNGDREMNGHDVDVSANVTFTLSADRRAIHRTVELSLREAVRDHTSFRTTIVEAEPCFVAPAGTVIRPFAVSAAISTRTESHKDAHTTAGSGALQSIDIVSDTVKHNDDCWFTNVRFRPIQLHFEHVEDLAQAAPR